MPGTLCEHCTGVCCRYVALPIETPQTPEDFDDIRWYLLHENISVFVEDGEWYINMATPCRHLQPDNRCGIYARRPRICRAYGEDNCDYHSGDYGWEEHFTCPEHLDAYVRAKSGKRSSNSRNKSRYTNNKKNRNNRDIKLIGRSKPGKKTKNGRGAARRPAPRPRPADGRALAAADHDIAGVPLPVLDGAP